MTEEPASPLQAQMWAVDHLRGGDIGYLTCEVLRVEGALDPERLRGCLAELAGRHDTLLTGFRFDGETLWQTTAGGAEPLLDVYDLSAEDDPAARFADLVQGVLERPMPLDRPPLVRWLLGTAGPVSHLAVVLHHIVADGWSMDILLDELGTLYAGEDPGPAPAPYRDYARDLAARMSDGTLDDARAFWRTALDGAPPTSTVAGVGLRPSYRGDHRLSAIPPAVLAAVSDLAGAAGASPYMVHLTALVLLLAERDGLDDVVVGLPAANRTHEDHFGTVGPFMNPLPIRVRLHDATDRLAVLHRVRDAILDALSYEELPFSAIARQQPNADPSSLTPLFQVMTAQRTFASSDLRFAGHRATRRRLWTPTAKYDLVVTFPTEAADPDVVIEFDLGRYDTRVVEELATGYQETLARLVADPRGPCRPAAPETAGFGAHRRVHAAARRHPLRPAVVHGADWLSYRELDERAARIAAGLHRRGVGPGDLVMVALPRGAAFVAAALGALYAGAGYAPVDPSWPEERKARVRAECRAAVEDDVDIGTETAEPAAVHPGDLAYVIFTSGSTGEPKPVAVPHGSLDRFVDADQPFAVRPRDRVAHISDLAFDASVFEIWGTLAAGGTLVVPASAAPGPQDYADLFADCTAALVTSGLFAQLVRYQPARTALRRLDLLIVGGDVLDPGAARQVARPETRQLNAYGPTEATVIATTGSLLAVTDRSTTPIGAPVAGAHVHIMDEGMRPVPDGEPGDLYVGGALALGYRGRAAATAQRFRPDPCGGGARVYATGDRVRRLPDGDLDFMGRHDRQVKVRGYRVELDEIETVLRAAPGVATARVLVRDPGTQLVAVVQPLADDGAVTGERLTERLRRTLPDFMQPHELHVVSEIPLTPIGKIDLDALADLGGAAGKPDPEPPPGRDRRRDRMSRLWSQALGRTVAPDVDFFQAGGDSMDAIGLLIAVANEFGVPVTPEDLFANSTLDQFIAHFEGLLPDVLEQR